MRHLSGGIKFDEFVKLNKFIDDETLEIWNELDAARSADGKTSVHLAAVLPALVSIDLRNVVQHSDGWDQNPNMTAARHAVAKKMESQLLPIIKRLVTSNRKLAGVKDNGDATPLYVAQGPWNNNNDNNNDNNNKGRGITPMQSPFYVLCGGFGSQGVSVHTSTAQTPHNLLVDVV